MGTLWYWTFDSLAAWAVRHAFIGRIPGVDVRASREEVVARLWPHHLAVITEIGFRSADVALAEQVHSNAVAVVEPGSRQPVYPGVDALVTAMPGIVLGIHVADCCAVFLVDRLGRAVGLVHAGREGTRLGVVPAAIEAMSARFGCRREDLVVQLSPCIRPPDYEVDFALEIRRQCAGCGVTDVHDDGTSTAADLTRFYSYRMEKGRTGRMLALLGLPRVFRS